MSEIPRTFQDVAQKHGIILTKDDPLRLLEVYCMEVLKTGLEEQQKALLEEFSQKLDFEYHKWNAEMEQRTKRVGDRILEEDSLLSNCDPVQQLFLQRRKRLFPLS